MAKNIGDYLHLYWGCECEIKHYNEKFTRVLTGSVLSFWGGNQYQSVKPILRPITDITDGECLQLTLQILNDGLSKDDQIVLDEVDARIVRGDGGLMVDADCAVVLELSCRCFEGQLAIRLNGDTDLWNEDEKPVVVSGQAANVLWFLSKRFDLFGLIDAGLAIDKTKEVRHA